MENEKRGKGSQKGAKGSQKEAKGSPRGNKKRPKCIYKSIFEKDIETNANKLDCPTFPRTIFGTILLFTVSATSSVAVAEYSSLLTDIWGPLEH